MGSATRRCRTSSQKRRSGASTKSSEKDSSSSRATQTLRQLNTKPNRRRSKQSSTQSCRRSTSKALQLDRPTTCVATLVQLTQLLRKSQLTTSTDQLSHRLTYDRIRIVNSL